PFGGVALSNVGSLGLDRGFAPLVPHTHVPLVVAMGAVRQAPRVEDGAVVAARAMDLTYTFDGRAMTELEGGAPAAAIVRRLERAEGWLAREAPCPPHSPSPTCTSASAPRSGGWRR